MKILNIEFSRIILTILAILSAIYGIYTGDPNKWLAALIILSYVALVNEIDCIKDGTKKRNK